MQTVFGRPQQAPRNPQHRNHETTAKHIIRDGGGDRNHGARPHLTSAWQRAQCGARGRRGGGEQRILPLRRPVLSHPVGAAIQIRR